MQKITTFCDFYNKFFYYLKKISKFFSRSESVTLITNNNPLNKMTYARLISLVTVLHLNKYLHGIAYHIIFR